MDSNNMYVDIIEDDIIKNKKRGDILHYSVNQVANLLGEEDSSIRYFTNVFDNILQIEIADKELRYTNRDIDKLEFLINLKNKGMTIKEIQRYCEALPLGLEELVEIKENNSLSAKEIITTIVGLENKEINNLKEEQEKQLNQFKDELLGEIKQYIDYKFDIEYKSIRDLYNELSLKVDNLISEKVSLEDDIKSHLNKFNDITNSRNAQLIDEIRKFKNVIERAYYVQQEVETPKQKMGFISKLFGTR